MPYVDAGTQTKWAGLMQRETVRPNMLLSAPPNTTTPPDEMLTEKSQFVYGIPSIGEPQFVPSRPAPPTMSLLERRQNPSRLNPHIPLPSATLPASTSASELEVTAEDPLSPPATRALLSPLPEANRRHAGHTPLIPRTPSPQPEAAADLPVRQAPEQQTTEDGTATPDADQALTGALTLPSNPVDGAEDRIPLSALDNMLAKISRQQADLRGDSDDEARRPSESQSNESRRPSEAESNERDPEDGLRLSRVVSGDSSRKGSGSAASGAEDIDGIRLKTPPSNFGAPLGSL
jgi:hypothetical protein